MKTRIYTLTSPIHDKTAIERQTKSFLASLKDAGLDYEDKGEDYGSYGESDLDIVFVRTGGTEGEFLRLTKQYPALTSHPVYLLASGDSNSLAASVEILSWLKQHGLYGEILHGASKYVAARAMQLAKINQARKALNGTRAGIIGQPSDWLIASQADEKQVAEKLGVTLVNIPIQELLEEIMRHEAAHSAAIIEEASLKPCESPYFQGAINIYQALQSIIEKYNLNAITLRCFDLLTTVRNTGCLALALLNAKGRPSSCEGDVPALLTMMIAQALTGQTGFQANPSQINPETGEVLFAHCTAPFSMLRDYVYDTHFESGIGVALHGELPEGAATVCKTNGRLDKWFTEDVTLLRNGYQKSLCRTQVTLQTKETASYLLRAPLGNHHVILTGHHKALFDAFMQQIA